MIIWYPNSLFASLVSILGCIAAIFAGYDMTSADGVLTQEGAIGAIAGGIAMVIVGKVISVRKAANATGQAQQSVENTYQTGPVKAKRVGASAILAAILFLLAGAFVCVEWVSTGVLDSLSTRGYALLGIVIAAYVMLGGACFHTRAAQKVGALHAMGYLLFTGIYAWNAYETYMVFGFDPYYNADGSITYGIALVHVIMTGVFLLMLLMSICARGGANGAAAVIVKILWLVPAIALAVVTARDIADAGIVEETKYWIDSGNFTVRRHYSGLVSMLSLNLAVLFSGWSFMRLCSRYRAKRVRVSPDA